ncbi:MAG: tRNA dihydrouridine(20/20a) synthase DusA [bacterium]|nr:tRNA dihydrouridine(20/20a) synthase DusA [bacterium]
MSDAENPRGRLWPLSVAPMMDRTDRHYRYFLRRITRRTLLYTEMVTTGAILKGDRDRYLGFDDDEKPLALQLGGDDPAQLAECARIAEDFGYDEVNLNVGCPSDRVQQGRFGACLMAKPQRVADAVAAMRAAVRIPVTVKHRIGVDDLDHYDHMRHFVETVAEARCDRFSVHARKAWLSGLSPRENREIPPLRYEDVHRLKRELPDLTIEVNGGITTLEQAEDHLRHVDGVMIGRAAYDRPYLFAEADRRFFGDDSRPPSRRQVVEAMLPYMERWHRQGAPVSRVTRHMLQLFAGQPGARAWRRYLSENAPRPGSGPEVVRAALARVPDEVLDNSFAAVSSRRAVPAGVD